jgi:hypothetical protein
MIFRPVIVAQFQSVRRRSHPRVSISRLLARVGLTRSMGTEIVERREHFGDLPTPARSAASWAPTSSVSVPSIIAVRHHPH